MGFFSIASLVTCGFQAYSGLVTAKVVTMVFWSFPFLALGVFCGSFCYAKTASENYRRAITAMLLALGLLLVGKAALG